MSTLISALTDGVLYGGTGNSSSNSIFSHGSYNYNSLSFPQEDNGVPGILITTTPSLATTALPNPAPELNDDNINRLKFVILGVMGSVVAVLGFLGNTMSMIVLQQRQMKSSTSYYLLSLAIYDNFILLSMLVYFIIPALAINIPFMKNYLVGYSITEPIGYPLSLTAQMGSIYTCVGFTVERFIAVCRPLQVANTCTKSRTIRAIVLIFLWSVVYNIPRFFHLRAVYFYQDSDPPGGESGLTLTSHDGDISHTVSSLFYHNASYLPNSMPSSQFASSRFPCSDETISSLSSSSSSSSDFMHTLPLPCKSPRNVSIINSLSEFIHNAAVQSIETSFGAYNNINNDDNDNNDITLSSSPWSSNSLTPSLSLSGSESHLPPVKILLTKSFSTIPPIPSHFKPSSVLLSNPLTSTADSSSSLSSSSSSTSGSSRSPPIKLVKALATSFGSNPIFRNIYLIYSQLFFMFLLPFLIILFMNIGLIRAVKRSKSMQQQMVTSASARKERNLTVMLIAVIVVFLVCQFPTIIDNILIAVFGAPKLYPIYTYQCFYTACTLMVLINAASNFVLYCFFGKKFRMVFLSLLGIKKRQQYIAYRSTMLRSRSNGSRVCDIEVSVV